MGNCLSHAPRGILCEDWNLHLLTSCLFFDSYHLIGTEKKAHALPTKEQWWRPSVVQLWSYSLQHDDIVLYIFFLLISQLQVQPVVTMGKSYTYFLTISPMLYNIKIMPNHVPYALSIRGTFSPKPALKGMAFVDWYVGSGHHVLVASLHLFTLFLLLRWSLLPRIVALKGLVLTFSYI